MSKNIQVTLASRPVGWVKESDFKVVETDIPKAGPGQVLVRNLWLSLDPYMRGRMNDVQSYAASVKIGGVMVGATVGEVVESDNPSFKKGDHVLGYYGWQLYGVSDGRELQKVDPKAAPLSAYLGALGMPGLTAWFGLIEIGAPKAGETVVVSAAAGAVGSVVGQIAKIKGCRTVGIAGGKSKCDHVVNDLGFDACIDYKAGNLAKDLAAATPKGIDIYFENVGGEILEAVTARLNPFARIPLCGLISQYNEVRPHGLNNLVLLLINRVKLQGFIVSDYAGRSAPAVAELAKWVAEGKIKYRETIANGIENAPSAFLGLLKGANVGKQLVKLS
ncbi:MAG: NADP-dependent oxidoreductase [Candidatus Binataceae bacterium]